MNIRNTANYLLALACNLKICHPFIERYFCHIVRLPTDLLDVVQYFNNLPDRYLVLPALPNCLREAIKAKFKQFDLYQLSKYCGESYRKKQCAKFVKQKSSLEKINL